MYKSEKLVDYLTLGVSLATAGALVGTYFLNKRQLKINAEHLKAQHELTRLQILEKKTQMNGSNFRNATGIEDISTIIPNQQSRTQDWCSFYAELKRRYGKNTANIIFGKAWDRRRGSSVDVNAVRSCTGQELDRSWFEALQGEGEGVLSSIKGVFKFGSTTTKIVVWGGIAVMFVLVGTYIYKVITFKPKEWEGLAGSVSTGATRALIKK